VARACYHLGALAAGRLGFGGDVAGSVGRKVGIASAVVVVVAVAAGLWWLFFVASEPDPFEGAQEAARSYADGWVAGDLGAVPYAAPTVGEEVAREVATATEDIGPAQGEQPTRVEVVSFTEDPDDDTRASARLAVEWSVLDGRAAWTYETDLALLREEDRWGVVWAPSLVHPDLGEREVLVGERTTAERGDLLDGSGVALFTERPVVTVGIATTPAGSATPTGAQLQQTAATVAAVVGVDPAALQTRVADAPPDYFVEVVTLRRERYEQVRAEIFDLPGTRFASSTRSLPPTPDFARAVLGRVGEATAEDIEQGGGAVVAGDLVGQGGLQEAFDRTLAGGPGLVVRIEPAEPDPAQPAAVADDDAVAEPRIVFEVAPVDGTDVPTTLDPVVQIAAEAALAGAPGPAALVAVRPSTGELLAVANGGAGSDGFNRAMEGQYPPGSTFKVVTTTALLGAGLSPDEVVDCPPGVTVEGRTFVNAESAALGPVPFRTDFAQSCNTAFIGLAPGVSDAQLAAAGAALGLRDDYELGLPSFGGDVPASGSAVDHAAAAIGQGRVLASPLGMATVAASLAQGTTVTPVLVLDATATGGPADGAAASAGTTATTAAPPSAALDPAVAATVRELMREVVVGGTSTVLAPVPGAPVLAKSGTAEFGSGTPPPTHAWMIAIQGDLAVAVVVEGGGFGARTAGPLLAQFLGSLA
jgi:cell division protein FtsI/penicillin-binding protein 2